MMEKSVILIPISLGGGSVQSGGGDGGLGRNKIFSAVTRDFWYADGRKVDIEYVVSTPSVNSPIAISTNTLQSRPRSGYNGSPLYISHGIDGELVRDNTLVYGMRLRADRGDREAVVANVLLEGSSVANVTVPANKLSVSAHYYEVVINCKTGEISLFQDSAFLRSYRLYPADQQPEVLPKITVNFGINPTSPYLADSNYTYAWFQDPYILIDDGDLGEDAKLGPIFIKTAFLSEFIAPNGWVPKYEYDGGNEVSCLNNINAVKNPGTRDRYVSTDPVGTPATVKFAKPVEEDILVAQLQVDVSKLPGSNAKLVTEVTMADKTRDTSEVIPLIDPGTDGLRVMYSQVQMGSLRNAEGGIVGLTNEDIANTTVMFRGKAI